MAVRAADLRIAAGECEEARARGWSETTGMVVAVDAPLAVEEEEVGSTRA